MPYVKLLYYHTRRLARLQRRLELQRAAQGAQSGDTGLSYSDADIERLRGMNRRG